MKLVLLGPPGVGKGTQAHLLSDKLGIPKISTGDILRQAVAQNTPLGRTAKKTIGQGKLVSDDVMIGIIDEKLRQSDCSDGFILDGFPRTLPQADALAVITPIDAALSFFVNSDELIERLEGRRTCKRCQKMYHVQFNPPKQAGMCDVCGGDLFQRRDDHRETIEKRLKEYQKQTAPLLDYYRKKHYLKEVDGMGEISQVFRRVLEALSIA